MSWVFLAGDRVYKLKKPVRTEFLDFSTLSQRRKVVLDEIRLNRRLAPDVYLGAQALRLRGTRLSLDDEGDVVDWLVKMRRLPQRATLDRALRENRATRSDLDRISGLLAHFYKGLEPAPISAEEYVSRFEREHEKTAEILTDPVFAFAGERLTQSLCAFRGAFNAARPLLSERVRQGRIVEGHGDLRPEHVFLSDPPVIIDCLEFSSSLRSVDPFDEIAFLGLECARLGANWVFPQLAERLSKALHDRPDPHLFALYWRYRALLRARLSLMHLAEPVVRKPRKWRPLAWQYVELANDAELRTLPRRDR